MMALNQLSEQSAMRASAGEQRRDPMPGGMRSRVPMK